jgi:FtsP/CotA-like multicopper oxidase with cupredoxin domain
VQSFGTEVAPAAVAALPAWSALQPGTYIYEAGTMPSLEVPMGLYGLLIVTAPGATTGTLQAYADATTLYDADVALLFGEIDPVQNAAVDAAANAGAPAQRRFDDPLCTTTAPCYPAAVNYTPTYFLINGKAFNAASPLSSAFAPFPASTYGNGKILLRMANAGSHTHIPSVVGLRLALIGEDGHEAPGLPKVQSEALLTAGKTIDAFVSPTSATVANVHSAQLCDL